MKIIWKIIIAVVLIVSVGGVWFVGRHSDKQGLELRDTGKLRRLKQGRPRSLDSSKQAVRGAMAKVRFEKQKEKYRLNDSSVFSNLKGEDRRLAEDLQKKLDNLEFDSVVLAAESALRSKTPMLREMAVDALGWFGAEALPELTPLMADPNEEVAQTAIHCWEQGLAEIEGSRDRLSITAAAIGTISDVNALESLSGQFSNAAIEYIDEEEDESVAMEKRVEVVQLLLDMMDDNDENNVRTRVAREAYEDITGSKWCGVEEAERYLRDPDNYEEPDN